MRKKILILMILVLSLTGCKKSVSKIIDESDIFTKRDLIQEVDTTDSVSYTVSDNKDITITDEGIYVISGSAKNMTIIVDAEDEKVQLVLDNLTIENDNIPCIYVKNADKVFVTTVNDNSLTVNDEFTSLGEINTDAVIFSRDDLVLNGTGTLTINSSDHGITGKDDLKITGGTINITSKSHGIEANDSISVYDGNITIKTDKDGLHAEYDEDDSEGYIYIEGGTFNIESGDDGIRGTTFVQIDGGTFNIDAVEGIEATYIQINDGNITINASDDGINASQKSSKYDVCIEINGGNISIDMSEGDTDGLDSNGNLYINGGTLNINCNSPFDYDKEGKLNGGDITVNGEKTTELTNQMMGGGPGGGRGGRR